MNLVEPIVASVLGGLVLAALLAWTTRFGNQFLRRAWLAIKNRFRSKPSNSEKRFLLVLCWLKNDAKGHGTEVVAQAFTRVAGIKLVRSARIIAVPGDDADKWRPAMRESARRVLGKV